jgi:glutamyl-tRNA reductase
VSQTITPTEGRTRAGLPLAVVGCDFRTAPASHRELLVTTPEERAELAAAIMRVDGSAGFLALETCNRVEWIVSCESPAWMAELLKAQMLSRWASRLVDEVELPEVYGFVGDDAARHIFRVVAGMESLATGEAEIAGQFQRALQRAMLEETSTRILNGLGRFTGGISKTSAKAGFRSGHTRGIHVLSGLFVKERVGGAGAGKVAVVGMGEIGRKTADFLEQSADFEVVRVNRTIRPQHEGIWHPVSRLYAISKEVVAIVIASGARQPIVGPGTVAVEGRTRPLVILDIGIPQQVDRSIRRAEAVHYFDVDDLVEMNRVGIDAATVASMEQEVEKQVARFHSYCMEREWVTLLKTTQSKRFDMLGEDLDAFVASRLGDVLDDVAAQRVAQTMRELVREYSSDVFSAVHKALEEQWNND